MQPRYSTFITPISTILFRADASSTIGTGHIMRDLVLAQRLQQEHPKATIIFATLPLEGNLDKKIVQSGFKHISLTSHKTKELIQFIKKNKVDLLVVDHYDVTHKKEKKIKQKTGVKILAFDDTYEKHHCDIVLNHNINAKKKRYKNLVPKQCKVLCGEKYTLLRDEFYQAKQHRSQKMKKKRRVFLAMGGADHANLNIKILKVLQKFSNIKVEVVTTHSNKHLLQLQKYTKNKKNITLHINTDNIASLMAKSDFAIVTPSVILNEVIFMELPFIAIKTAKNQAQLYSYLKHKKLPVLKRFDKHKLYSTLKRGGYAC